MKIKRIFLTIPINASSGFDDSVWKNIFYDTIVDLGYDVYFYPYHKAKIKAGKGADKDKISQIILEEFESQNRIQKFDLFFSYYHENNISTSLFQALKGKVFILNYTTNFHQIASYNELLKVSDLSTYASIAAKEYFLNHGFPGYYLPFAGLKKYAKRPDDKKNGKISFVGTAYGNRPYYLWRALQQELPLDIFGSGWTKKRKLKAFLRGMEIERRLLLNSNPVDQSYKLLNDLIVKEINKKYSHQIFDPLSDTDYFDLLSNSSITLNFPESRFNHDYNNPNVLLGANLRDFEVPTAGGCLLTQDNAEIRTFFEPDKEIITFNNEWELVDKAKIYLKNANYLHRISMAGHKRAIEEHTWDIRFEKLLKHVETNLL